MTNKEIIKEFREWKVQEKPCVEEIEMWWLSKLEAQKQEIKRVIELRLKYCREQNGLPHCKNCGLNKKDLKALNNL